MATVIYPYSKSMNKLNKYSKIEWQYSDCGRVVIAKGNIFEGIPGVW